MSVSIRVLVQNNGKIKGNIILRSHIVTRKYGIFSPCYSIPVPVLQLILLWTATLSHALRAYTGLFAHLAAFVPLQDSILSPVYTVGLLLNGMFVVHVWAYYARMRMLHYMYGLFTQVTCADSASLWFVVHAILC